MSRLVAWLVAFSLACATAPAPRAPIGNRGGDLQPVVRIEMPGRHCMRGMPLPPLYSHAQLVVWALATETKCRAPYAGMGGVRR